jgi:hypothetical protein
MAMAQNLHSVFNIKDLFLGLGQSVLPRKEISCEGLSMSASKQSAGHKRLKGKRMDWASHFKAAGRISYNNNDDASILAEYTHADF